jgi:acyl dehydratase
VNNQQQSSFGRYLEDFHKGDVYNHWPGKTILESDNNLFCLLTMNHHPVHLDTHYAGQQLHGKIMVVGTLVFSLSVGMTVADISGCAIANLDYEEIKHLAPVFVGDTLYAFSEVLDVRESRSKNDRGVVYIETRVKNHDEEEVLSFRRHVLVPKKNGAFWGHKNVGIKCNNKR